MFGLSFDNPVAIIIDIVVLLVFISEIIAGYKKGFLQSGVKLLGLVISFFGAYFLKNPLSKYLYTNMPYFELGGIFKGVDAINILIYDIIAFVSVFAIISLILTIISNITKLDEKIMRVVAIVGIPNKVFGSILGILKATVFLYFVLSLFFVTSNFVKLDTGKSLGNYLIDFPILKNTFGSIVDSFDKISKLAVEYEDTQDKEKLENDAIDILLEYDIISREDLEILINNGKVVYSKEDKYEEDYIIGDKNEQVS